MSDDLLGGVSRELFAPNENAIHDAAPELPGFSVVALVGTGGYGSVWSAWQAEPTRRLVAIKVLRDRFPSAARAARFDGEAHILARLRHPGIASVFLSATEASGRPCIVMELVTGSALTTHADERRLDVKQRVALLAKVARAIQHAHACMVLHCDIKPSNILVSEIDGVSVPKVIDFGISRSLTLDDMVPTITQSRGAVGTIEFMAPEQMAGRLLDVRTDVYGLGAVAHTLLAGALPHDAEALRTAAATGAALTLEPASFETTLRTALNSRAQMEQVATQRATTIAGLQESLRGDLDWVVRKALDPDPSRRYETAAAFAEDLESWLEGRPIRAAPPSTLYRVRKWVRRNPVGAGASALAAAAILIGTTVSTSALIATQRQLRRVEALQEFQQSILLGIDPSIARGYDRRLLNVIVDRAAQGVNESLGDDPLLLADKELVLTRAYELADAMERARHFAERAEATVRASAGDGTLRHAEALSNLSSILSRAGDAEKGEAAGRRALEIRRSLLGPEDPETLSAEHNLALCLDALGKGIEAEALHRHVLASRERLLGADHGETLDARRDLAESLRKLERFDEALALATTYLEGVRRVKGDDAVELVLASNNVGTILLQLDRIDEALPHLQAAVDGGEEAYGERSMLVGIFKNNLAGMYRERKEYDRARAMYESLLPLFAVEVGPESVQVFTVRAHVANVDSLTGHHAKAIADHRLILADKQRALGKDHRSVLISWRLLADALERDGQMAEASRASAEAARLCAVVGFGPVVAASRWEYAARIGLGHVPRSETESALAQARALLDGVPESEDTRAVTEAIARVEQSLDGAPSAAPVGDQAEGR